MSKLQMAIAWYPVLGVAVFLLLAFGVKSERPPAGWWLDWSFLGAAVIVVCFWPLVLVAWLRKAVRA